MEERLVADALKLDAPYTGDGIEYLDRARPFLPTYDEYGLERIDFRDGGLLSSFMARDVLTKRFAWAVPNEEALAALVKLSPIVELGAGSGYWAMLLRERGAQVTAYDRYPYPLFNGQISYSHSPVAKGGPDRALRHHPERTLFMSWPYMNSMAADALKLHRGEHVAYIGEGLGGCTANEEFHLLLGLLYEEVDHVGIPRWMGLHDGLGIYRRTRRWDADAEAALQAVVAEYARRWDDDYEGDF